jgi:UDP-glucose 4-epimerase
MNYLLLGGAGFIGTHLAKRLISLGHKVTVIDSCITSSPPDYDVTFVQADIINTDIEQYVSDADIVYFLAGSVGVDNVVNNPKKTLMNNIGLVTKLIPLFEKYNKKVVFSSTSEVYGEGPFSEDNNLSIGPSTKLRWSYASAKLTTEFMITCSSFPFTIVRFFNIVGPGQLPDFGMVLPRFINAAKSNTDLVIHGDGSQIRSFCHVEDAVDMLLQVEKIDGQVFNVGNDEPVTIKQLAERVVALSDSKSNIQYMPLEQVYVKNHGDINRRVPVLDKIKQSINYKITYTLDDIIKDML